MRRVSTCLALLALTASVAADEPKVELKEAYWQKLAGVGWVDFDADRNPVFHLETGYYFAKTGKFVKYRENGPRVPAYFDRAGRVWVRDNLKAAVHLWDGAKWETLEHRPV